MRFLLIVLVSLFSLTGTEHGLVAASRQATAATSYNLLVRNSPTARWRPVGIYGASVAEQQRLQRDIRQWQSLGYSTRVVEVNGIPVVDKQ